MASRLCGMERQPSGYPPPQNPTSQQSKSSPVLRCFKDGGGVNSLGQSGVFLRTPVPEPATMGLLAAGGLLALRRRRQFSIDARTRLQDGNQAVCVKCHAVKVSVDDDESKPAARQQAGYERFQALNQYSTFAPNWTRPIRTIIPVARLLHHPKLSANSSPL
jgi:hypothetical protein